MSIYSGPELFVYNMQNYKASKIKG